jgi:hypothetical protein
MAVSRFVIVLLLSMNGFTARASSLDSELAKQTEVLISPVSANGSFFGARGYETELGASVICKALGYTRLVKFETESCQNNEPLLGVFAVATGAHYIHSIESCGSRQTLRFKSLVCAK